MSASKSPGKYAQISAVADDDVDSELPRISGGEDGASAYSRWTFGWVAPAVWEGSKLSHIEAEQLWGLQPQDQMENIEKEMKVAWDEQVASTNKQDLVVDAAVAASGQGPSMWNMPLAKAFWTVHKKLYVYCCLIKYANDFNQTFPPIILNQILQFLTDPTSLTDGEGDDSWYAFSMVVLLFVMMNIKTLVENNYFFHMMRMGMQIRVAVMGMVYRKALRLTNESKSHHTEGEIVNMMQQDSERMMMFIPSSPQLVSGVLQMVLNVSLLVYYVGVSVLPGIAILIILVPLNRMLMRMQMKLRFAGQKKSDERIKLINEVMKGIRVVKTYAWEDFLFERINTLRSTEVEMIRTRAYVRALASVCLWTAPAFAVVATFSTYVLVGNEMNAESLPTIFTAMMLFNNLRFPLMMYPMMLTQYGDSKVSLGRLQQFFARDEIKADRRGVTADRTTAISIRGGHFHWRASPKTEKKLGGSMGGIGGGRGGGGGGRGGGRGGGGGRVGGGGRGGGGGGGGGGKNSEVPSVVEMFKEQGTEQLCSCFRKDAVWGPTQVKVFTGLTITPTILLLFYQSFSANALPGERNLAILVAVFCLFISAYSYSIKREKMNEKAKQKAEEKKEAIESAIEVFKTDFKLKGVDLEIPAGQLVMVVGAVGSGKSSIVSAILGELDPVEGSVSVMPNARISYVAQGAWLMNATLRDNITFVSDYDEHKYDSVVDASGLRQDLAELPHGDQTEIGERGINLSGGQKQRISIARAMYNDADIYVFDDPLSALDAHVGQHVFQGVISQLVREGKTVVLVTNQLQFVNSADQLVFLKHDATTQEGWIEKQGSYADLMQNADFAELMKDVGAGDDEVIERSPMAGDKAKDDKDEKVDDKKADESSKGSGTPKAKGGQLTTEEEREQGAVSWDIYRGYLQLAKATQFFIGVVILCWSAQLTSVFNDWWLTWWTKDEFPSLPSAAYNIIYLLGAIAFSIFTFVNGVFWAQVGLLTAKNIHAKLLHTVLAGRMSFFDTTPVGRLISRFAKDMQAVDDNIPMQFDMCVRVVIILILNFCVIAYITPLFIVIVAPIMVLYWYVQKIYKLAALQYKRLDSTTRSPIYNQFSESLGGLATIRAYAVEDTCESKNSDIVNTNTRTQFTQRMVERWLSVRLECIGNLVVGVAGLLGVASAGSGTYAGFIGISLVYGMRVTGMLNWAVRSTTELATQMNCVERILHYVKTIEPEEQENAVEPPPGWPRQGVVEFRKYSMRYRPGLDLVLKEVQCVVEAGEKVGICGRTGSGKSSLMLALFRMIEPASGSIIIDGVDISTISLKNLRMRLSIIPQDPVLFSGTVSFNIDPTENSTDNEIWEALDKVHLGDKVRSLDGGLAATVSEYGDMFSTGQRQLVCMARALLRKTKVLLMDEATSSVDIDTDRQIQELVRTGFGDRTILTIAHRLNTIIDNDRILLMDFGRVAEYDSPKALLDDYDSSFSSLVRNTGDENEAKLRELAGARAPR